MKNSELIKKLQEFPSDMEVAIFDHRQNLFNHDDDGSGIGIHTEFKVWAPKADPEKFIALTFDNSDYEKDVSVDYGSLLGSKIENYTKQEGVKVIESLLQMPDILIDAVQNENTDHNAESLYEMAKTQ